MHSSAHNKLSKDVCGWLLGHTHMAAKRLVLLLL
jgi:hypothetical protein